jgi:peptide/nickel transport system substrate-binding protein
LALAAAALLCVVLLGGPLEDAAAQAKPEGEMRWALYVTLSPMWFDPGEIGGLTPFWVLYATHDALVKPMPGNLMTPSLAESWTVSADQRVYEFKLREGLKFHNGDPFTAEDVRFSFHRAKGSKILHDKVREVTIVDPYRVRFHLHEPWPDFMTFYGTLVSGAGWVVPKKYIERVGDDGFKKHKLAFSGGIASFFLDFLDQWDLAEAGYANGFDAGELHHTSGCGSRPSGNISGRAGWGRAWRSPR